MPCPCSAAYRLHQVLEALLAHYGAVHVLRAGRVPARVPRAVAPIAHGPPARPIVGARAQNSGLLLLLLLLLLHALRSRKPSNRVCCHVFPKIPLLLRLVSR